MLPIFDVVCSRKASGPWETPGIAGTSPDAGPGCGIPTAAGCIAGAVLAEEAIGDPPIGGAPPTAEAPPIPGAPPTAGADGPLFIIVSQC